MATTVEGTWSPAFTAILADTTASNRVADTLRAGQGTFKTLSKTLTNGTGSGKAQYLWHQQRTLTTLATDDLDLTALTSRFGAALSFANIKWFLLRIVTPLTGRYLTIGNATTNPWQAWFGVNTYTEDVRGQLWKENQIDGWTVSGTSKTLRIYNPTALSVVYDLVLLGE